MQRIGGITTEGFVQGIANRVLLVSRATEKLVTAAIFDSIRTHLANNSSAGGISPATIHRTINLCRRQSTCAIGVATNRPVGYAMSMDDL